jgi:hypothetical protein
MVVFIKGMECYKVDYNDNLERINARSSRSDRAMALVGAVDAVPPRRGEAGERRIFQDWVTTPPLRYNLHLTAARPCCFCRIT